MVNGMEIAPAGTVTAAGAEAAALLELAISTGTPPEPAGAFSVIVPVALAPPITDAGAIACVRRLHPAPRAQELPPTWRPSPLLL